MLFNGKALLISSTRLFRFHGNGLGTLFSFYGFRSQFMYSSTANAAPTHFLVKYLVDSLGFSTEEAISASAKVSSSKTSKNPDLVLNFFKQTGLDNTQMKFLVSKVPKMLFIDVSKTLKPKFECLMELGLSGSDLVNVIVNDSTILDRCLDTRLRPTIECVRRILGCDENVLKAIKRSPWLFSFGDCTTIETNVSMLRDHGLSDVQIKKLMLRNPRYITQRPEWVKDLLHRVENDFGIPRESPMFIYGFNTLASHKKSTLEMKIGTFKSFGWSHEDILVMFRKLPYCMAYSEARLQKALTLYMKEVGYEPAYLASHPAILVYSIEKRAIPRMQVLKILDDKKLPRKRVALCSVLGLVESKFIKDFVLPYKDQIPDLYESFKKSVAPL